MNREPQPARAHTVRLTHGTRIARQRGVPRSDYAAADLGPVIRVSFRKIAEGVAPPADSPDRPAPAIRRAV
jgi:hypothetical protein